MSRLPSESVGNPSVNTPKGPFRTKNSTESKFTTARKFGTEVTKRYGKGSQVLIFPGKRGRKTVYA